MFCGSVDKHLYCLELLTGKLRWKFETGGPITGGITANEEMIVFGSTDHKIYALPL